MGKAEKAVVDQGVEPSAEKRKRVRTEVRTTIRTGAKFAPRTANKTTVCHRFGWTRYEFDQAVTDGMPVVEMPSSKGGEWKVNLAAADRWVREKNERETAARRRYAEQEAREREEVRRLVDSMTPEQRRRAAGRR